MIWLARPALVTLLVTSTMVGAQEPVKTNGADIGIAIMGTIVNKSTEDSVALIKEDSGTVKAVKRDHVIGDKYKVVAVTAQYMELITRESKRFFVYPDKFADLVASKGTGPQLGGPSDSYKEEGFERSKGKITMSGLYRDKLVKEDLAKVLMQATAEPFLENGQIAGFKMSQIDENSIYEKAGVRNGDIITGINGQELNSVAGSIALMRSLKGADHLDIDVKRDGIVQKITVDVR